MAHEIAHLCAERHYVGSASSGRFATDRGVRPTYDRVPGAYVHARMGAVKTAWYAKYLRNQDVLGWVLDHADAKAFLAQAEDVMAELVRRRDAAKSPEAWNAAQKAIDLLEPQLSEALSIKQEASRQLRLLGVSPKDQARLLHEIRLRSE